MSMTGMIIMWVWFAVVFAIISTWHMGDESDQRKEYWKKFESK
jgi:hypothetical protein